MADISIRDLKRREFNFKKGTKKSVLKIGAYKMVLKNGTYRKIASSNTSRLEAHVDFFRLLMKGIFDSYVL